MTQKPICPYCEKKLTQLPTKKSKCKECNNYIYPWKHFQSKKIILFKKDELVKYDKEKANFYFIKKWKTTLKNLGISEKQYEKIKKKIKSPFEKDVIWSIFNQIIIDRSKKSKPDFHELKMIYYEMALFLNEEGKNPFNCLQSAKEMELLSLKQGSGNLKKVKISCSSGCQNCKNQAGKIYLIENAIKEKPLPNKNCSFYLQNGKYPFCRCLYIAEMDISDIL